MHKLTILSIMDVKGGEGIKNLVYYIIVNNTQRKIYFKILKHWIIESENCCLQLNKNIFYLAGCGTAHNSYLIIFDSKSRSGSFKCYQQFRNNDKKKV